MFSDYELDDSVSSCVEIVCDDEAVDESAKVSVPTSYCDARHAGAGSAKFLSAIQMLVEAQVLVDSSLLPVYEDDGISVNPTQVVEHLVFDDI